LRILLTGIAGFIGSHLAAKLIDRGHAVIGLDCFDETLYPAALHERNLATLGQSPRLRFVRGDLLDVALVDSLFDGEPIDVVVHLAALAGVRPSLQQPMRYMRVNVEGTQLLLEACRRHHVGRFVFASSSSVYGAHNQVPFSEADPAVRPASPYAASKRAGELLCSNYSDLYRIATTALRFFTVYGPRQRPEMAIHKFAKLIWDGKPVPMFGDGKSARDYTFITDILDGIVAAIDKTEGDAHRVYNLGGSRTTTLTELVDRLALELGRTANLEWLPDQPGDVPITYADVKHANWELGYSPQVSIEEGLAKFCEWFKTSV
jgi:UDP-glucuronate 4-epimerase